MTSLFEYLTSAQFVKKHIPILEVAQSLLAPEGPFDNQLPLSVYIYYNHILYLYTFEIVLLFELFHFEHNY